MKLKSILTMFFTALLFTACGGSDGPAVKFSQTDFVNVGYEQTTLTLSLETSLSWTATSMEDWCRVSQSKGEGDATLQLALEANIDKDRTGVVKIWTEKEIFDITIQQKAIPAGQEYTYKLPVVFHVMYEDANDKKQYIPQSRLAEILRDVNEFYDGNVRYSGGDKAQDINIDFVLAETDEDGNKLQTPGVDYIKVSNLTMNCQTFMRDNRYIKNIWDPNRFINVMLYNFAAVEGSIILGISHIPFSLTSTSLEGTNIIDDKYVNLTKEEVGFPMCVSINSLYAYEKTENGIYNSFDVSVSLAHELGHYLGLLHAFDEDDNGLSTACVNSDYCDDTPSYNRVAYEYDLRYLLQEAKKEGREVDMAEGTLRENCKTGESFNSYNLMDYEMSYADRFTPDQRARIRHILSYSPLIPGPKKGNRASTRIPGEKLDVEPMVVVCQH